jgi:hypothetical protein
LLGPHTHRSRDGAALAAPGHAPSRGIALWKDPHRGLQEIALAPDAVAVALTAHTRPVQVLSADGRSGKQVAELVLSGIDQIE